MHPGLARSSWRLRGRQPDRPAADPAARCRSRRAAGRSGHRHAPSPMPHLRGGDELNAKSFPHNPDRVRCLRRDWLPAHWRLAEGHLLVGGGNIDGGDHMVMQNTKTMETRHRTCNRCRQSLPLSEFHRDRTLRAGRRYTCGTCAAKAARRSELARYRATNGLSSTWRSMLRRCLNPRHKSYPQYGGRGISVCREWKNGFDDFFQWAQMSGHQPGLQLDRIDNDGP